MHPYVDGELELVRTLQIEQHLDECPACAQMRDRIEAVRAAVSNAALRHRAPAELARRIRMEIRTALQDGGMESATGASVVSRPAASDTATSDIASSEIARSHIAPSSALSGGVTARRDARNMSWRWFSIAAAMFLLASLAGTLAFFGSRGSSAELVAQQIVTSHIRSLLAEHLLDVVSTDQYTVKPWFTGKLDFSPPVEDFADAGFVLSGGRLDVIGDQTVAALVYRHRKHVINLFIWPSSNDLAAPPDALTRDGFHLRCWTGQDMRFAAVSDLNEAELQQFVNLLAARLAPKR
jgi:anti-sigma factor RsiW